ncbi:hypothetical protein CPC16_007342 [Podila verticillata]|nr:hypothetical protein CPC16_007342 [Podila verticillata]
MTNTNDLLILPVRSVLAPHMERAPSTETPKPKPKSLALDEQEECKEEKFHLLTLSQHMKQLLEQAEETMSKAKISSLTFGDKQREDKKLECGGLLVR